MVLAGPPAMTLDRRNDIYDEPLRVMSFAAIFGIGTVVPTATGELITVSMLGTVVGDSTSNGMLGVAVLADGGWDTCTPDSAKNPAVGLYLDSAVYFNAYIRDQWMTALDGYTNIADRSAPYSDAVISTNCQVFSTSAWEVTDVWIGFANGGPDILTSDSLVLTQQVWTASPIARSSCLRRRARSRLRSRPCSSSVRLRPQQTSTVTDS